MIYYLSFGDKQGGFRGGALMEAIDGEAALWDATRQNLNLGGEVLIVKVPMECEQESRPHLNRTLTMPELKVIFRELLTENEIPDDAPVTVISANDNPVKGGRA